MPTVLVNTWIMSINPANFSRYEPDYREMICQNIEDDAESDAQYEKIDYTKTDESKMIKHIGKQVFDWMMEKKVLKGLTKIRGFSIKFHDTFTHGLVGNKIEMKVSFQYKADLVAKIKTLAKKKDFREFMVKNYSHGSGFHSFIPNNPEGLIEQNDSTYMMGVILGYIVQKNTKDGFVNDYTSEDAPFDAIHACDAMMNADYECYQFIRFNK